MRCPFPVLSFVFGICLVSLLQAQEAPPPSAPVDSPWWVTFALGSGQLKLESDQLAKDRVPAFSVGFSVGRRVTQHLRAGLKAGGWTLQTFDLNNPTVGESVGGVMAIADVFPLRNHPLFARGGIGYGTYTNNTPAGRNGSGLTWEGGGGYEIRLSRSLRLLPMVEYCGGHLGNAGAFAGQTNTRYSVIEFNVGVLYRFGG